MIAGQVVLAQLHGGIRFAARPRIDQADGLHRPEAQRVGPAVRHDLNRQTAFEESLLVEIVHGRRFGCDQRLIEGLVLARVSAGNSGNRRRHRRRRRTMGLAEAGHCRSPHRAGPAQAATMVSVVSCRTVRRRLRSHRDCLNTFERSMVSARTIGLMAS